MSWIRSALRELIGLFVEDGSFALAIAAWLLITVFVLPRLLPSEWCGPLLFAGVVVLLIENVARSVRKNRY